MNAHITKEMMENYAQARNERVKRSNLRVLVNIENELTYRQVVSMLPLDTEFVVVETYEGMLQTYLATAPDMVLLDPEVGSEEDLAQIYALDSEHFVILLADHMSQKKIMDALEAGAQGFLTKPYTQRKVSHYLNVLQAAKMLRSELSYYSATIQ